MKIGGIDVGTTGCKISVYNELGEFLGKAYKEYEVSRKTGEHEIDADIVFEGVKAVIKEVVSVVGNIDAIGVTTLGETFVMLDENDKALFPSMLYTDTRGSEEAESFDADRVAEIAGVKPHSMYSLPKMMWIKNNHPEVYEKAKRILLFEDYIVYMLSGKAQIDRSLAARTMALDIRSCKWSKELFDFAGIDVNKMSEVVPSGSVAGKIKEDIGLELGLTDTVIVNGCHDQVAAALGSGIIKSGLAVDGTGTVECVTPMFDKIPDNKEVYDNNYPIVPYVFDGKYVCYALSYTGGAAIKWFKDNFAPNLSYKELDAMVDNTPGDILVMPHFAGGGNPYMDPFSKAAFIGVTLETTVGDLYKAVMEGVTYEMLLNLNCLKKTGIAPDHLYATGGGASSPVWLQMKANILGVPVTSLEAPEAGAAGTVILAGLAIGAFDGFEQAVSVMVKENKTYYPDSELHKKHMEIFGRYEQIYNAVRPLV